MLKQYFKLLHNYLLKENYCNIKSKLNNRKLHENKTRTEYKAGKMLQELKFDEYYLAE